MFIMAQFSSATHQQVDAVKCDYCDSRVPYQEFGKQGGWKFGQRGMVVSPMTCALQSEIKHACPTDLCQARLLVWARS